MFGLGFGEIILILAVALIVLGPKKLPGVAQALGRGLAEFRRITDDVQKTIQREIHTPLEEEVLRDLDPSRVQVKPGPPPADPPADPPAAETPPAPQKSSDGSSAEA